MTANQIYKLPPASATNELYQLAATSHIHIPEVGMEDSYWCGAVTERVETRIIEYVNFDGRRYWQLATVWFDGKPVMIIQNAGREGRDHARRFVTDARLLLEMASHIRSLSEIEEELCITDPDEDVPELTSFYSRELQNREPL